MFNNQKTFNRVLGTKKSLNFFNSDTNLKFKMKKFPWFLVSDSWFCHSWSCHNLILSSKFLFPDFCRNNMIEYLVLSNIRSCHLIFDLHLTWQNRGFTVINIKSSNIWRRLTLEKFDFQLLAKSVTINSIRFLCFLFLHIKN